MGNNNYNLDDENKKLRIAELKEEVQAILKKHGFESSTSLLEYHAEKRGLTLKEYRLSLARAQGFDSLDEFVEHMSTNGAEFDSYEEYNRYYQKQYRDELAKRKGFASFEDYLENSEELNQYLKKLGRTFYSEDSVPKFGDLIHEKLGILGKTQSWFAEEMHISVSAVSYYINNKGLPPPRLQQKILKILNRKIQKLNPKAKAL